MRFTLLSPRPPRPALCLCLLGLKKFHLDQPVSILLGSSALAALGRNGRRAAGHPWETAVCVGATLGQCGRDPECPLGLWPGTDTRVRQSQRQTDHLDSFKVGRSSLHLGFLIYLTQVTPRIGLRGREKKSCELSPSLAKHLTFLWLRMHVPNTRVYI